MTSRVFTLILSFACLMAQLRGVEAASQAPSTTGVQYATNGNPTSAVATPDGKYLFVSVTNVDAPNFSGPDSAAGARANVVSGVQVFQSTRGALKPLHIVKIGGTGANGLILLRGAKTLAVGAGDAGVAFLDVGAVIRGDAVPVFAAQGKRAGTFDLVASNDGKYVFTANEYGVIDGQRGNVGIIATGINKNGFVSSPSTIGHLPLGDVVPSLTISPDSSRLYVASELVPKSSSQIHGTNDPILTRSNCVQKKGSAPRSGGYISVLDVARLIHLDAEHTVLSRVASGCSPVRIAISHDASFLYVSARGDNAVLEFSARKLELDPDHSFERSLVTGGTAPVGVLLFHHDRYLAIANSNRFDDAPGALALLDLKSAAPVPVILNAGQFPRNLTLSPDGQTVFMTNYISRSVQLASVRR